MDRVIEIGVPGIVAITIRFVHDDIEATPEVRELIWDKLSEVMDHWNFLVGQKEK